MPQSAPPVLIFCFLGLSVIVAQGYFCCDWLDWPACPPSVFTDTDV